MRPNRIPGVEIRKRRPRGGQAQHAYRVRFQNARGKRDQRTFDSPQDALDFKARLRLLKRSGDLPALESGRQTLERFMEEFWRLYVETRLERSTRRKYRCLWNAHIERRLGAMELRQITPLVLSEFVLELEEAGAGAATIRSCLGLLQSMFARAVEWDRAIVRRATVLVEQKWIDGEIVAGQKTNRPPRCPPLLDALQADLREYQRACGGPGGLIFARPDGTPWRDHDWRDWRSRVWQPACQAIGIATITKTTTVSNGARKTKRTYAGPVPYDLRHSFASLLIHEGKHSIVQISEALLVLAHRAATADSAGA